MLCERFINRRWGRSLASECPPESAPLRASELASGPGWTLPFRILPGKAALLALQRAHLELAAVGMYWAALSMLFQAHCFWELGLLSVYLLSFRLTETQVHTLLVRWPKLQCSPFPASGLLTLGMLPPWASGEGIPCRQVPVT